MPISYILQKLDELKKSIDNLAWCHNDFQRETRDNIKELKKRMRLLEQSHSENELKGNANNAKENN